MLYSTFHQGKYLRANLKIDVYSFLLPLSYFNPLLLMKYILILLLVLLFSCKKTPEMRPSFQEPPMGISYVYVEQDNQEILYQEGAEHIEIGGSFVSSTKHNNLGNGMVFRNTATATHWRINFFFSEEEYKKNTGNFTKLFNEGNYPFIRLDKEYNYTVTKGVEIETCQQLSEFFCQGGSTSYQQSEQPQKFTVTKAYFYNLTYDRFIWVEGEFDCWLNDAGFNNAKRIKGKFRIKVQHDE